MAITTKPIIGLTPQHDTENDNISMRPTYIRALKAAGAIPLILPLGSSKEDLRRLADLCQGFIFTGGPDPHPFLWGEEIHRNCGPISTKRDSMELMLLSIAMDQKKPILGLCRGAQLLNVGLGGDIYQDIDSQYQSPFPIAHRQPLDSSLPAHHVNVQPDTLLASIAGQKSIQVNSFHHQAVRNLAPGLVAGGFSPDGLIEEVEMPDYPFLIGVQWHPEYLWKNDETSKALFLRFVDACRKEPEEADQV